MDYTNEEMLEAIEVLESAKQHGCRVRDDAIDIAEQAINKQISKKPIVEPQYSLFDKTYTYDLYYCPCCTGSRIQIISNFYCCPYCGQVIDWSE